MFVARNHELEALNAAYETPGFQMSVVYGRRRVGKTRLLRKFAEDKPRTIFLTSLESTAADNLAALSRSIYRADVTDRTANSDLADASFPRFPSFEDALRSIFAQARERRLLLIVDEYPYLAGSYPGISSLLQSLIDEHKETSRLHLILCGSSMSFMEHQVLGHKSPLYGRRTIQLKVKPFDYLDASKMLPDADPTHIIELYAIVGGIPLYLEQLDSANSTEWNIANRVLPTGALLNAEPLNYLLQDVRNPATYNAIIAAIARGRVRPAEIGDAIRIDRARRRPAQKPNRVSDRNANRTRFGPKPQEGPVPHQRQPVPILVHLHAEIRIARRSGKGERRCTPHDEEGVPGVRWTGIRGHLPAVDHATGRRRRS